MQLFAPLYYPKFHCIADKCSHSCCVGWEIDVDDRMLAVYHAVGGQMGQEICAGIHEDADGAYFAMKADGRCPMLDDRGLCRIISTLGEGYLCYICREHPRFYNTVGERMEVGVGAACEEAARLILAEKNYVETLLVEDDGEKSAGTVGDFDTFAARAALYAVLADDSLPYLQRLEKLAAYCPNGLLVDATTLSARLSELEYLNEAHRAVFAVYEEPPVPQAATVVAAERFLAYLIYRHTGGENDAEGFSAALGAALVMERLFRYLADVRGLSYVESAVTVSEEMEYSEENTAALRGETLSS